MNGRCRQYQIGIHVISLQPDKALKTTNYMTRIYQSELPRNDLNKVTKIHKNTFERFSFIYLAFSKLYL